MADVLLLNRKQVIDLLSMRDAIAVVEDAFSALARGEAEIPPVINIQIPKFKGEVDIKSGYVGSIDTVAVKIAGGFWQNPQKLGLPSVIGTILLVDGSTGLPLALMDGSYITAVRTGAAGAVAAKYLSRENAQAVGIIGAGSQARMQLRGLIEVRPIRSVSVFDPVDQERALSYAHEMEHEKPGLKIKIVASVEEAVADADVVVTTTPSTTPLVRSEWIRQGTHITAIGADAPGKQELDPLILKRARVVVDRLSQCRLIGETQHALKCGVILEGDIYAEIGEITAGLKRGRQSDGEVTLFDSTGVAVQDIATASLVYRTARDKGAGTVLQWL